MLRSFRAEVQLAKEGNSRQAVESTDPDAIVDKGRKLELHMPSDRPGMLMCERLSPC
jgi:hypothetical protein